jgi:protein-S-isoprenylcysteine O-methyltransferase Ste14
MATEVPDRPRYPLPAPGVELAPIVALALIVILRLVAPVSFLPRGVSLAVGTPLLVVGVGLFGWAQASILAAGENPAPQTSTARLVTGGAFRRSRNPIYTGGTIGLFGLAVLLDTATGMGVVLLLGLLARSAALAEEPYLEAKFGDEYRELPLARSPLDLESLPRSDGSDVASRSRRLGTEVVMPTEAVERGRRPLLQAGEG